MQPIPMSFEEMHAIYEENARLIAEGYAPYPTANLIARVPPGITYTVEEGQLVRMYHGRPETAWYLCETPTWALREALTWNDPSGCYLTVHASDAVDLIAVQFSTDGG